MSTVKIIQYDDGKHRDQLYDLLLEYANWHKHQLRTKYDVDYEDVIGGSFEEVGKTFFPAITSLEPPKGLILVLEDGKKVVGMGRLSILEDDIAEINNMFIGGDYRGHGYGKKILGQLIEKAREYGYKTLRLDTSAYSEVAQHIYIEAGFHEIEHYDSSPHGRVAKNTTEAGRIYYSIKKYMEKQL